MAKKQLRALEATLDLILDVEAPNRFIGVCLPKHKIQPRIKLLF